MPITIGAWAIRVAQRVAHRPPGDAHEIADRAWQRLVAVTPTRRVWLIGLGWSGVNWLADCACLAIAFLAVGAPVPWQGLLLAYGAGQLAANLPITPGGLGAVEGGLTIALVAYGNSEASPVAAVLLSRVVSFWAMLPLGWTAWAVLTTRGRRLNQDTPPAQGPERPSERGTQGHASVCFRSLAVASDAVHQKGKLVGVRRVSAHELAEQMPNATAAGRDPVCLVAFKSDYRPGEVDHAQPPGPGRYAVVAVTTGAPTLLGAQVTDRLPLRFRHPACDPALGGRSGPGVSWNSQTLHRLIEGSCQVGAAHCLRREQPG